MTMHQARTGVASYRDSSHWAPGDAEVQHPGRVADCALCLLSSDPGDDLADLAAWLAGLPAASRL